MRGEAPIKGFKDVKKHQLNLNFLTDQALVEGNTPQVKKESIIFKDSLLSFLTN